MLDVYASAVVIYDYGDAAAAKLLQKRNVF